MKWFKYLIALSGMLLVTQFISSSNAYATTDYDGVVVNASQLKLSYPGYSDLDITTSYMGYILGSNTNGVAQNTCDSTCQSIINSSLDYGGYAINQVYSNYPSDNWKVQAAFCDQAITSTAFNTQYYGSSRRDALDASTAYPANCTFVTISYQTVTSGDHIFVSAANTTNATDDIFSVATVFKNGSGVLQSSSQPFVYTGSFTPPVGYEGETPRAAYTTTAPTSLYSGTIDCGGAMPVAMSIFQPGNIGAANLTQVSLGIAQWSYSLTSEPYSFTVDCGDGKLATPYGAIDPASSSNDWMCDVISAEPYHCALT